MHGTPPRFMRTTPDVRLNPRSPTKVRRMLPVTCVRAWAGNVDYSAESWIDLCAKQLAMRLLDLSQAQCVAFAENLHRDAGDMSPIEAANFFSQLYRDLQEAARKPNE